MGEEAFARFWPYMAAFSVYVAGVLVGFVRALSLSLKGGGDPNETAGRAIIWPVWLPYHLLRKSRRKTL